MTETRKLGFKYGGIVYLSDSFALLKDKVLELGAHRIGGQPGTGVDIRKVIETVDQDALNALARDYPIEYLDETPEEIAEDLAEKLEESMIGTPEDLFEIGRRIAIEVVYNFRNERTSLDGFVDQSYDLAAIRGFSHKYGYSDEELDTLYAGFMNVLETSEKRVAALNLAYSLRDAEAEKPSVRFVASWLSHALAAQANEPVPTLPSPIASLMQTMAELISHMYEDFPATAGEVASAAKQLAEAGDSDGYRELVNLMQAEHNNPSRSTLAAVDAFLIKLEEEPDYDSMWIGAATVPLIGRIEDMTAAALALRTPIDASKAARRVRQFATLTELIGTPDVELADFSFETNLERDDDLARLLKRIAYAWLIDGKTITLSPPESNEGDDVIPAAGYVTIAGWEDK